MSGLKQMIDARDEAFQTVLTELGLAVLFYADIERSLKLVLPFIRQPGSPHSSDPFADLWQLLKGKNTMGPLVEGLKSAVSIEDPEGFSRYLAQVVENRNELFHAFRTLPFGLLRDASECSEAAFYLADRRAYAEPFSRLLTELAARISLGFVNAERVGTAQHDTVSLEVKVFQAP